MGKESGRRQSARMQNVLGELVARVEPPPRASADPGSDLAESFRNAGKALDSAARDVAALRKRVAKPPKA